MNQRGRSAWMFASICLTVLVGLVLLPGATARSAAVQTLPPPASLTETGIAATHAIAADGDPTSVIMDKDGYTVWTYEYPDSWCVMYSRIAYPFNLGTQDPSALSDARLLLTFAERIWVVDVEGKPLYTDPTWAVALNGKPGAWTQDGSAFNGDWNIIGAIGTTPTWPDTIPVEQEVAFDYTELIDGQNLLWFQQQDFCHCANPSDCACTCYNLTKLQLRARGKLAVKEVWPEPDARNVITELNTTLPSTPPEIRVRFTTVVSEATVNENTFQVSYRNDKKEPVYVAGKTRRLTETEYAFVPDAPLKDGIRYQVSVWGETDTLKANRTDWVQDLGGGALEIGKHWVFWTLPQLEVRLEPVQVLQDEKLVVGKPTVLRVFLSSANLHTDVWYKDWWDYVDVEDIKIVWTPPSVANPVVVSWRADGTDWHFDYGPTTARRYRLYDKATRLASQDTVNYYGFVPDEVGEYGIVATVTVFDNHGTPQRFSAQATPTAVQTRWLNIHSRALAVGPDYGKTGTVNLSSTALGYRGGVQAIYPVPNVWMPQTPSAIPYYAPMASWVLSSTPASDSAKLAALLDLTSLCFTTSGCDLMIGYAPKNWLVDIGLTSPRQAWYGILADNQYNSNYRFIVAHEAGHLYSFVEHDTLQGGMGYDVRLRADRRISTAFMDPHHQKTLNIINSFMNELPVESPEPERLWIEWIKYQSLLNRFTTATQASRQTALADALLLATGLITPATGEVELAPWYQLEPGEWEEPPAGPYRFVFLDNAGQEIVGYTRAFSVATSLQYAGRDATDLPPDVPAPFALKVPYPATTARIQIRRNNPDELLAERTLSATPPTISITPPVSATWTGPQPIAWESDPGETRHFLVQVSTDNGATWEAQAIHLPGAVFTLETASMLNTARALVRVHATDGLNTAVVTAGPFTITNPVRVDYVSPAPDATNINVDQPLYAGFRADMDPTTIHSATFTLSGPYGTVRGLVRYDADSREATFVPQIRLAYSTTYTAHVSAAIQTLDGTPLAEGATWSFTTEPDLSPPRPTLLSPQHGALDVPRNTVVAVAWDRSLDASTLTTATFRMAELRGAVITGSVAYTAATHTATFTPDALLAPYTAYVVTLTAGISDTLGNATFDPTVWAFTTDDATPGLALTGSYADWGNDSNGDGLYEQLVIRVGVQVTATGDYALSGSLVDVDGGEITWDFITRTLTTGAHFLDLAFDGVAIGGHGVDGPYTLTDLTLTNISNLAAVPPTTSRRDAYHTFAYPVGRFPAPLRFSGLPDVVILPGTPFLDAFNVRDYAQHLTRASDQLSYTVMLNTNVRMDVVLETPGTVSLTPEQYWQGSTEVTIRASDGVYAVQDTFKATVGWPRAVYLPVVLRSYGIPIRRDAWITGTDDFEYETIGWHRSGGTSHVGPLPPGVEFGIYLWDLSTCRAYSGQQSVWAYGGGDDGDLLPCGAPYPDAYSLGTMLNKTMPIDLEYVAKGEYSAKVWTNLPPGDKVCLKVGLLSPGASDCDYGASGYYGVCRTGVTKGWEDLKLDLSNVPTLGNVLGQPRVCMAITFHAEEGDSRPEGAYVDDVSMRLCPQELTDLCAGSVGTVPPMKPLVAGNIGGYPKAVGETALAVETNGRAHALWTGKLNDAFNTYVFYSSSNDGINWTPYQILGYWGGREPRIAVDNVHGRVHLAYANDEGIVHRTVVNGVVSAPTVVAPRHLYYLPGFDLPSGGLGWTNLAVAEDTGVAYLTWDEVYYVKAEYGGYTIRRRTWHATWNGGTWSAPLRKINDRDTYYSSIAAAPDGQAMLAWFQRWEQSSGGGITPGDPIVARTAYGTAPGRFPLRQATHALYPAPQRDESIVLAYAPGADAFVLASYHTMYPGYSQAYRYIWKDGAWSEPLNVAENTSGLGVPYYIGAATDTPLIRYVYGDNAGLKTRTETDGTLGPAQTIADYMAARGYTGSPGAYFTDAAGGLHMLISGEKNGVAGFYYVKP